jgi:nucleotide-binding universal stress UspA family protein
VLVHALLPESPPAPDLVPMPEQYYRGVRDEARAKLEALMTARLGADVIAMGTRDRPALERLWLGSTAERVVATAPCPVLTVRCPRL